MKMGYEKSRITWQDHNYKKEARDLLVAPGTYRHYALRSGQESKFAKLLEILVRSGSVLHWWYEPHKFDLGYYWDKKRVYTPDFLVALGDDDIFDTGTRSVWVEVKATLSQKDISRFRWFKKKYPDLPIIVMVRKSYILHHENSKTAKRQRVLQRNAEKYCERILSGTEWYK